MKKKWICTVCGYVHEGDEAPEFCLNVNNQKANLKN
mgnify:CR=1 FL=1